MRISAILIEVAISVLYWVLVVIVVTIIRFYGLDMIYEEAMTKPLAELMRADIPGGVIGGIIWALIGIVDSQVLRKKKKSLGVTVLTKTVIYCAAFFATIFGAVWIAGQSSASAKAFITSKLMLGNFLVFIIAAFIFNFFRQMNRKLGPGVLVKYLTGKYFSPREENRIFMFLDLGSSTAIAEKLDHTLYSKFIQDCFAELTEPLLASKGEIYQYVGDAAVITWETKNGLKNAKSLDFFFEFSRSLEMKKDYFLKCYRIFPQFKAGIHIGFVTVAEVGELKTEIAYHGDTVNTAARIQGYCDMENRRFLASEAFVNAIPNHQGLHFHYVGNIQLKGKEGKTKIYSIQVNAT